jgi:hypothetical protein
VLIQIRSTTPTVLASCHACGKRMAVRKELSSSGKLTLLSDHPEAKVSRTPRLQPPLACRRAEIQARSGKVSCIHLCVGPEKMTQRNSAVSGCLHRVCRRVCGVSLIWTVDFYMDFCVWRAGERSLLRHANRLASCLIDCLGATV